MEAIEFCRVVRHSVSKGQKPSNYEPMAKKILGEEKAREFFIELETISKTLFPIPVKTSDKLWTVGMPVFDKETEDGVQPEAIRAIFTAMSILTHHPLVDEVIIVDNNPLEDSAIKDFVKSTNKVRYVPMPEPQGTMPPKNRVFTEARNDYVACIDSHILLYSGFFEALNRMYDSLGVDCSDLFQGPIMTERGTIYGTHFNNQWRGQMWGTWGTAWQTQNGELFSLITEDNQLMTYMNMPTDGSMQRPLYTQEIIEYGLPFNLPFPGHEAVLIGQGCTQPTEPFQIPGQGMGFFACRKEAWLPFHADCRGFGGEEMTTHVRFRQAGRRCWCVPGAKWWHHFQRPHNNKKGASGAPYRITVWDKVRNYVLEFKRLGLDLNLIRNHFDWQVMEESEFQDIIAGKNWPGDRHDGEKQAPRPKDIPADVIRPIGEGCGGHKQQIALSVPQLTKTVDELYLELIRNPNSLEAHDGPALCTLAGRCGQDDGPGEVIELGTGVLTIALLKGAKSLITYAQNKPKPGGGELGKLASETFRPRITSDSVELKINDCDLLFINTEPYTAEHIIKELLAHKDQVRRFIVVSGSTLYGNKWGKKLGIIPGIRGFLGKHKEWTSISRSNSPFGLIVLAREDRDKSQPPDLLRQALGLGAAIFKHVRSGMVQTEQPERLRRLEICVLCPHRFHDKCGLCGCLLEKKAGWKEEACPDNPPRW